ncbi:GDP-mannose 4,6-dehydratase [Planctomycetes bacterium LzC2]|uniref:GDP-mannose 4,6-dehydratase n=2 Tax=Alienimonas chondri TaxID=2681879 RepID=A0ABX1VEB5_9PLAN|nr:GDP-mannose 4,6-dehydratase [Alienimonas chondri]
MVSHFDRLGAVMHGVDNNMRADFFGPSGDTASNLALLRAECPRFVHHNLDVRKRSGVDQLVQEVQPDLIVHAAAQPSHDLAADRPFDDFDVNAGGTLNLLEATRRHVPEAVFVFLSTNKVYGDAPNRLPLNESETRWDYAREDDRGGIDESMSIDGCMHSLFGASKVAADVMVQEYGRYFGMKTCTFRGGCLTGSRHAGAQQHGFLNYLVKTAVAGQPYTIFGYGGKQVRDQIHAEDVARAAEAVYQNPRPGEVYNLGGGRENAASVLECIELIAELSGRRLEPGYRDEPRRGDHICYITDLTKFRSHYPEWDLTWTLSAIVEDQVAAARDALNGKAEVQA